MSLLKKKSKGIDVLDLTPLQRRGLLKVPEQRLPSGVKVTADGSIDLRDMIPASEPAQNMLSGNNATASTGASTAASESRNPFSMLDAFAHAASAPSSDSSLSALNMSAAALPETLAPAEFNALKLKLEDVGEPPENRAIYGGGGSPSILKSKTKTQRLQDVEYKIERLMEKLSKIEEKLAKD